MRKAIFSAIGVSLILVVIAICTGATAILTVILGAIGLCWGFCTALVHSSQPFNWGTERVKKILGLKGDAFSFIIFFLAMFIPPLLLVEEFHISTYSYAQWLRVFTLIFAYGSVAYYFGKMSERIASAQNYSRDTDAGPASGIGNMK